MTKLTGQQTYATVAEKSELLNFQSGGDDEGERKRGGFGRGGRQGDRAQ
jgi:hypothetical protein